MFGYVTPCKMEMKIKDYEKFKAYYCGLCNSIKNNYGNLPRLTLNFDMTFLAILLDSLGDNKSSFTEFRCLIHPLMKRVMVVNNEALDYAAFSNTTLAYYKLMDDASDDKTMKSKVFSLFLRNYLSKSKIEYIDVMKYTKEKLLLLNTLEVNHGDISLDEHEALSIDEQLSIDEHLTIDELSHVFADLTGFIISFYFKDSPFTDDLYWLGYNLGKWIYIIDAYDDLEKDMKSNSFNAINSLFNVDKLDFKNFSIFIKPRVDYILTTCAHQCLKNLNSLPLIRNEDILYNILELGLMEKMDKVFNRKLNIDYLKGEEYKNDKSL